MRPKTLAEVAVLAGQGDSFDRCLANFLDEFYAAPNSSALSETPSFLAPGLPRLWPPCAPCSCWKARLHSVPVIFRQRECAVPCMR
jgi:hypothetical protein